jgi:Flp pilus assembly protein TadD
MPQTVIDERNRVKARYLEAVRDWARRGSDSVHALSAAEVAKRIAQADPAVALAHAHFRLGLQLLRNGRDDEAREQFARAIDLHPDSWAIWRQSAAKDARGLASGPEFWARVDALGERRYYPPSDIVGD